MTDQISLHLMHNLGVTLISTFQWLTHGSNIISQAALEDGAAAAKREAVKLQKYAGELDMWGRSSNCIALVFEHFARWGHDALQFLNRLSILSKR